jgi:putative salt-induced outer membrane protein
LRDIRRFLLLLTMLTGPFMATPIFAQGAAPPPPPAREGSAEFAAVATSGNTSTRSLGLSGELIFRPPRWVFDTKTAYVQNTVEGALAARSFFITFRGSRQLTARVSAFGQVGYLKDRFSGIANRTAIEGGISAAWEKGRQSFSVDGSAGYANEQRLIPPDLSTAVAGAGARYKLKISETSDFTEEFRYTQSLSTGADYRLNNLVALTAKLTTLLSLKVSNIVRFVNAPVPGFRKTDTITSTALVAKF